MTSIPGLPRSLPAALEPLVELALDLSWSWSQVDDLLWRRMDPELWERTGDPWLLLQMVSGARLRELATDRDFVTAVEVQSRERRRALESPGWFPESRRAELRRAAYFSMEFGVHDALPLYAGGLGILAGDHLKTASDLDLPLVGVGILWQQGYFRQTLDEEGRQHEHHPHNDPATLPVQPVHGADGDPLEVRLELPGRKIRLRVWLATVGRVPLYLLDSNHPLNDPLDRGITATLYGADPEVRLLQELVLGIAGWRLLAALGLEVDVCHLNEGHAAFVILERAQHFMRSQGVSFPEALWATRAGNVFTTHTAVPAGFDTFPRSIIDRYIPYFDDYVRRLGLTWSDLLALGRRNRADPDEPFSMAYLAMRGCARVNGVSRLHGEVSRRLFQPLFSDWPDPEVPVGHVTNGVHIPSWDSPGADRIWTGKGGHDRWAGELGELPAAVEGCSDEALWEMRNEECRHLVDVVRARLRRRESRRGATGPELEETGRVLDPAVLTLGFARRFTAYKRPTLLLADPNRLEALLGHPRRPIQLVVAGKAHPADGVGQALIARWFHFARRPGVRGRVVFVEDYDMTLARELVQGVDLWLNTPRRPWEASGTSGMKTLVNGGLNLSERDGWWAEAYEPGVGWALPDPEPASEEEEDRQQAEGLYQLLEAEVAPLFYDRDDAGLPRKWIRRVRASMSTLTPRFSGNRMLREYVDLAYLPAAAELRRRCADGARLARELASWEVRIREVWPRLRFGEVTREAGGGEVTVTAELVGVGDRPGDIRVELYAEPRGGPPFRKEMEADASGAPLPGAEGCARFRLTVTTDRPADHFTPRALPHHPAVRVPAELPLVRWA